jgi:hypothetical protein
MSSCSCATSARSAVAAAVCSATDALYSRTTPSDSEARNAARAGAAKPISSQMRDSDAAVLLASASRSETDAPGIAVKQPLSWAKAKAFANAARAGAK